MIGWRRCHWMWIMIGRPRNHVRSWCEQAIGWKLRVRLFITSSWATVLSTVFGCVTVWNCCRIFRIGLNFERSFSSNLIIWFVVHYKTFLVIQSSHCKSPFTWVTNSNCVVIIQSNTSGVRFNFHVERKLSFCNIWNFGSGHTFWKAVWVQSH